MKVVYIPNKSEQGGAFRSQKEVIDTLKNNYGVVPVVLTYRDGMLSKWCREKGIETYTIGYEPFMIGGGCTKLRRLVKTMLIPHYKLKRKKGNNAAFERIEKLVDFSGVDIIHTNVNRDDFGARLSKKYGIPHVWHIRETGEKDYDCIYLRNNPIDFMNGIDGLFIVISDAVKKAWAGRGLDEKKMRRVYNGINLSVYPENIEHDFTKPDLNFIFTGTLCENKGQIQAIKAIEALPDEIKKHIHLDLYGGGAQSYIDSLKRYVSAHGLSDRISFCGYTDKLNEILPEYEGAFVCSRNEAFGRVTVEHMYTGLAVIASDSGANPEIITDGKDGFLYRSEDVSSLRDCIVRVFESRDSLPEITARARKRVADNFTKEINAGNIYGIYEEVIRLYGKEKA